MEAWKNTYRNIHTKAYGISMVKPQPSKWIEENIILPEGVSRYKGPFSYDLSPYAREIVDTLSGDHPARSIAVMKGAQIGLTQGLIVPGMCYTIANDAAPMLFMAADKELAQKTIEERLDPILQSSGLHHLIRPSVIRSKNQRTGDTSSSKEYAGGRLSIEGMRNADKLRQISVRILYADDYDGAPRSDKNEGSIRKLFEARQTSYGNLAKTYYVSTPTLKGASNIEEVYLLGDQRKWHWHCPCCGERFTPEWSVSLENGGYAGVVWQLDSKGRLIKESVKYKCPHCLELIPESKKYDMNLGGIWIPSVEAQVENFYSYHINSLCCPPGFDTWVDLVKEWLEANPPGQPVKKTLLQAFLNTRMGVTWEEKGETPRANSLMSNVRDYPTGIIPDITSEEDGNGRILLVTLACDLGGVMEQDLKDVRLDWEIKAHSENGQSYSVSHGSIGTFRRVRESSKKERETYWDREKWTYDLNQTNSVWNVFEEIIKNEIHCESGITRNIDLTLIDTGFFTNYANKFIETMDEYMVFGIKGNTEAGFRAYTKDSPLIKRSKQYNNLYILESNFIKDLVADNMKLITTYDGLQPEGFMNFPEPDADHYTYNKYFSHFESERRVENIKNGESVGFKWEKVRQNNHFWDIHCYNFAARDIFIDILKRTDPTTFKNITWADLGSILQ